MVSKFKARGFTLIEVLIAMAITALVAIVSYSALSAAISSAEALRISTERARDIGQVMAILSRDIRQVAKRPVIDEFGQRMPAVLGGALARDELTLTRAGWHNSTGAPRSTLQRVHWWIEDETLWRGYFPVLDRTVGTERIETAVLNEVEGFEVRFLPSLAMLEINRDDVIDRKNWEDSWVADVSQPNQGLPPPAAVEVTMEVSGLGEVKRLYVLPEH
ncbi:MAG: type II secretion system minor pseudopilin GspJ [Luminiphilus sp.]|jgi:general secretion pathway protein J|nr:type II secretion system minor pseudopilin GspJ [Luminiphilus sp.]